MDGPSDSMKYTSKGVKNINKDMNTLERVVTHSRRVACFREMYSTLWRIRGYFPLM